MVNYPGCGELHKLFCFFSFNWTQNMTNRFLRFGNGTSRLPLLRKSNMYTSKENRESLIEISAFVIHACRNKKCIYFLILRKHNMKILGQVALVKIHFLEKK